MKSKKIIIASAAALFVITTGTIVARADTKTPDQPAWVQADGKINLNKIPDNAELPYQCWSGKNIKITGKTYKKMADSQAVPGSTDYQTGVEKMNDLHKIPGTVTIDNSGNEVVNIDDNNPAVVGVMKKYEKKEMPQCQ